MSGEDAVLLAPWPPLRIVEVVDEWLSDDASLPSSGSGRGTDG